MCQTEIELLRGVISQYEEEIAALKNRVAELTAAVARFESCDVEINDELDAANERVDELEKDVAEKDAELEEKDAEIEELNERIENLESDLRDEIKNEINDVLIRANLANVELRARLKNLQKELEDSENRRREWWKNASYERRRYEALDAKYNALTRERKREPEPNLA